MRSSVVGAFYSKNLNMAWEIGCMTSVPTHNNLEPILCAGVVSVLCAAAITGVGWSQAFQDAIARVENWRTSVPCYPHEVAIGPSYSNQDPAYVAHHLKGAFEAANAGKCDGAFTRENGDDLPLSQRPPRQSSLIPDTKISAILRKTARHGPVTATPQPRSPERSRVRALAPKPFPLNGGATSKCQTIFTTSPGASARLPRTPGSPADPDPSPPAPARRPSSSPHILR